MAQFNSRRRGPKRPPANRWDASTSERSAATEQTIARNHPDPFPDLIAAGLLPPNARSLADTLAEAYKLRTPGCGYGTTGVHGTSVDTPRSEALQLAWVAWAGSIYKLTHIHPHTYVKWAIDGLDSRVAGLMSRALTYWSRDLAVAWKQVNPEGQGSAAA